MIDAGSGKFKPTTALGGVAHVSATYANLIATTTVTIRLHISQNGAPPTAGGVADAGVGGVGGVGGEGLGGKVADPDVDRLGGQGTPPASATELGWLYPYDRTVGDVAKATPACPRSHRPRSGRDSDLTWAHIPA